MPSLPLLALKMDLRDAAVGVGRHLDDHFALVGGIGVVRVVARGIHMRTRAQDCDRAGGRCLPRA